MPLPHRRGRKHLILIQWLHPAVAVQAAGIRVFQAVPNRLVQLEIHVLNTPAAQVLRGEVLAVYQHLVVLRPLHIPGLRDFKAKLCLYMGVKTSPPSSVSR